MRFDARMFRLPRQRDDLVVVFERCTGLLACPTRRRRSAFKAKFHPAWLPRYLVYPGAASLPMVAIALIPAATFRGRISRDSLGSASND
jgi:hypothetical protein